MTLKAFMSESRVTPTIKTCDRAGDNIRGSWKSPARHWPTLMLAAQSMSSRWPSAKLSASSRASTLSSKWTSSAQSSAFWQRVRVLVFDFSAARCRHSGVDPLPIVSVFETLRQGGFTQLSIPLNLSSKVRSPDF